MNQQRTGELVYLPVARADASTLTKLEIDTSHFALIYDRGATADLTQLAVNLVTYENGSAVSTQSIPRTDYQVFVNPSMDYGEFALVTADTYVFDREGVAQLKVTYRDYTSDVVNISVNQTSGDYTIYFIILTVVLLFIVGSVYLVKQYRAGKGMFAKKKQRDQELVEAYKKELAEKAKAKEEAIKKAQGNAPKADAKPEDKPESQPIDSDKKPSDTEKK